VTLSIVFHVKAVTFYKTTLAICVTLSDFQTATLAIQLSASLVTPELFSKTKLVTFARPDSLSVLNALIRSAHYAQSLLY
jgi:hypothetical protein